MGRAKRRLELLINLKERNRTYQKRMEGMKKKAYELKTLCDVQVCLIVHNGPKLNKDSSLIEEPQIWPSDPDLIKQLITSHKAQPADDRSTRSVDLSNFHKAQKLKIEREIIELKGKNKNENDMYPTWDDTYNVLTTKQLEEFGRLLGEKLQYLKSKMETMRRESNYFQKKVAAQNEFCFRRPTSYIKSKTENTYDSFEENKVSSENSGVNLSIENASCYTQLENLYSSEFLRGLMEEPIAIDFDHLIPDHEGYF